MLFYGSFHHNSRLEMVFLLKIKRIIGSFFTFFCRICNKIKLQVCIQNITQDTKGFSVIVKSFKRSIKNEN